MNNFKKLKNVFADAFQQSPELIVRAPGRINFIGEHTDYNNGFVLPAAIDKAVYMAFAKSSSQTGEWIALDLNKRVEIDFNDIKPANDSWQNYLLGVVDQFNKRGCNVSSFNCIITSTVPVGAGMSSSAALECATALGIQHLYGFNINKLEIAKMCQAAEHEYAGAKVGIMDMFASLYGKKDKVIKLDCRSLEYEYFPLNIPSYEIILFDTGVKHELASGEYNVRRKQCEEGAAILKKYDANIQSLRDVPMKLLQQHKNEMDEIIYKRCFYVIDEISRTLAACKDLLRNDIIAFGKKMYATHDGLSKLYEVSCDELDFLADAVRNNTDTAGARMMGGGFGGCTINLIKENAVDDLYKELKERYKNKFQKELKMYKVRADDGADVL